MVPVWILTTRCKGVPYTFRTYAARIDEMFAYVQTDGEAYDTEADTSDKQRHVGEITNHLTDTITKEKGDDPHVETYLPMPDPACSRIPPMRASHTGRHDGKGCRRADPSHHGCP